VSSKIGNPYLHTNPTVVIVVAVLLPILFVISLVWYVFKGD